ncbi:hypothetical protein ARC78_06265 [Stenotrophomonas pictorum JCM 9942]|uniref:Uncharacterized protein n=1 Tax=Stenotrophomonas pictorum JCM 9942 TaxID=1236960 RepID=A0A0R0AGE0_9GAMM|nr:hypothetical protein [Stenotrophomonas pictorum]KRG44155.1 hypothetical protein ARC78_06265 [Stenotrophomonas pictorum JCM 9942]
MYATLDSTAFDGRLPLPQVLDQSPGSNPHRRNHVNDFVLLPREVERFNQLLARLGRTQPLEADQLATAARSLGSNASSNTAPSACIRQRLQQARLVEQMLQDDDWEPVAEAVSCARCVLGYLHENRQLIPDSVPGVGQLDQAIVIDTAWPQLAGEVANFLDYQRLRRIEAERQGRDYTEIAFSRSLWLELREIEARLHEHQRRVRENSYAPEPMRYFRVH